MLDGGVNKFVALFISAVLFSLMHLFNPSFCLRPVFEYHAGGLFLGSFLYIHAQPLFPHCLALVLELDSRFCFGI